MDNNNASQKRNIDIWQQNQQQIPLNDQNKQFYQNHYQPMQHGFDLQREITQQPATPDNVHFLRDNNGPYVKIYYSDNNKEYELFDQRNQQQDNLVFMNNMDMFNNYIPNTQMPFQPMMNQAQNNNNNANSKNNSVIHHLVTSNLGPGKFEFGTFGGHNSSNINNNNTSTSSNQFTSTSPLNISIPTLLDHHVKSHTYNNNVSSENFERSSTDSSSPINNTSLQSPTSANNKDVNANNSVNNKKPRIVAEVKPMRLSYSDVVSKNHGQQQTTSIGQTNSASSSPNTTMPVSSKTNKTKYTPSNSFEKKQQDEKNRKSPTNPIIINNSNPTMSSEKRNQPIPVRAEKAQTTVTNLPQNVSKINNKKKQQATKDSLNTKASKNDRVKSQENNINNNNNSSRNETDSEEDEFEEDNSSMLDSENDEDNAIRSDYYDIRKNVYQGEHHKVVEKNKSAAGYKKKQSSTSSTGKRGTEKSQKRVSGKMTNRKQKREFIQKLFTSCVEYLYIFIKWLWLLIYDVSYLSFGIILDRLSWTYHCAQKGVSYARREFSGNPGKILILWIKNQWKKFDSKFDKKSKWAFWRWMFKKQSNSENAKDYYKDGKLPKTAEEAMKSLLNCKEKDAYSILGVSPDCPQEQIKKHYKKIAVLVHPDKNKQAGAEEAFKVLQRSFELIGEPESRKQYDDNLAKTLHTEKAFNELNDLLIQLQTKISEAANTIRCSSCCFRHQRKLTGRKAFAARECSTCKIRHSAREGDIWAETTFFGLRWKYLALMEGNVYDITEWALCQRGALSHLQANSCVVQYKIVLGGNQQNQTGERDNRFKKDAPAHEPQEDFFLNNIYAGQQNQHQGARRRNKKN